MLGIDRPTWNYFFRSYFYVPTSGGSG
ncbi:MAG: hypothetical protein ACJAXW_000452 [Candidatus Azotimanducaceae bacterium]